MTNLPRVMSVHQRAKTPKFTVKNDGKSKGVAKKTAKRHRATNLSINPPSKRILAQCAKVSGFSMTTLVEMACHEYLGPKWLH